MAEIEREPNLIHEGVVPQVPFSSEGRNIMRAFFLWAVLGISALGGLLTPSQADARPRWSSGYYSNYYSPGYSSYYYTPGYSSYYYDYAPPAGYDSYYFPDGYTGNGYYEYDYYPYSSGYSSYYYTPGYNRSYYYYPNRYYYRR
jgi:hypothetical protein